MAFTATLYKFSKKKNSTARPSTGTDFSVELKGDTEILNPTILLQVATYPDYNYAYIAEFDRYYFVRAITWTMGNWEIALEVDPLASWKDTIGGHTLYVTRSAIEARGDLVDMAYPTKKSSFQDYQDLVNPVTGGSPWEIDDIEDGTFVVGIIGTNVTYYAFRYVQWGAFLINLFGDDYLDSVVPDWASVYSDVYQDIKTKVNPLQFISSVVWFPLDYLDFGSPTVQSIPVGYGSISSSVKELDGTQLIRKLRSFQIPEHPQASSRGTFLNSKPYTDYALYYPPFGKFDLDPDIMADSESDLLDVYVDIDVRTGEATLTAQAGKFGSYILTWVHAKVGVNYQVSQVLNSGMGLGQLAQVGGSIAAGALFGGGIGAVGAGVVSGMNALGNYIDGKIPSASMVGSRGGINTLQGTPQLIVKYYEVVDDDNEHRGRPLCELYQINTLSGFTMVEPADVSIPCQASELEAIKTFMEGGFYYE